MIFKPILAILFFFLGAQAYQPVDKEFWKEVQEGLKDPKNTYVLKLADHRLKTAKKDSLEQAEGQLALAKGLRMHKLKYAALTLFVDLIKTKQGTEISYQALREVDFLLRQDVLAEDPLVTEVLYDLEYEKAPEDVLNFINFYSGYFNLSLGYKNWSQKNFSQIEASSYWGVKKKYLESVEDVKRGRVEAAEEEFREIVENKKTPSDIKKSAQRNLSRLLFEKSEYKKAFQMLKGVNINFSERGSLLLERAWSHFYLKEYSKALGLLKALGAPVFEMSRSPEAYILEMLIYKELCYYDQALETAKKFNERFKDSLDTIKKRDDLRKDKTLVNLASLDKQYGSFVEAFNVLKEEQKSLESFKDLSIYKKTNNFYNFKIKEVRSYLDSIMKDKLRVIANDILDWREQMQFLEYQTKIEDLRILKKPSQVNYQAENVSNVNFDKIYWTFKDEYWMDEIDNIKVLIDSRCEVSK